jgi:hypothetical protein
LKASTPENRIASQRAPAAALRSASVSGGAAEQQQNQHAQKRDSVETRLDRRSVVRSFHMMARDACLGERHQCGLQRLISVMV